MPKITSVHWNQTTGVCEKHHVPIVPCPKCMEQKDPNIEVELTKKDACVLESQALNPREEDHGVKDLFGPNEEWLLERFMSRKVS